MTPVRGGEVGLISGDMVNESSVKVGMLSGAPFVDIYVCSATFSGTLAELDAVDAECPEGKLLANGECSGDLLCVCPSDDECGEGVYSNCDVFGDGA